jgi:hypothetical protein
MIFFAVFWSAFAPIVLVILWLIGDELRQHHLHHSANGHLKSAATIATARRHRDR